MSARGPRSGLHGALAGQALFAQPSRLLRLPVPDAETAGDDHALDVGRAAWMLLDDPSPLLRFGDPVDRAQDGVVGQRLRSEEIENGLGQPEVRRLPEIRHLRAFVRPFLAGVDHPEITGRQQADRLKPAEDLGELRPDVGILDQRPAVAMLCPAMRQQRDPHRIGANVPLAAVLDFKMGRGDLPAVVLAAHEAVRRDADIVEEDDVLVAEFVGFALALRTEHIQRLRRDARQRGIDHEPGHVLVALALGIRHGDGPVAVGAVVRADVDLLAIHHIRVAIADRRGLDAGQIGSGGRFRQKLPAPDLAFVDRWKEALLLFLGAPDADAGAAHLSAAVVVRRQAKSKPRGFLLEHDDLIQIETAAAVLLFSRRIQPALRAELPAELAAHQINRARLLETSRTAQ